MLNVAGIRIRMSFAAVMLGAAPSVTVIGLIAVGACARAKTWFAADAIVGCTMERAAVARGRAPSGPEDHELQVVRPRGRGEALVLEPRDDDLVASGEVARHVEDE